MPDLEPEFTCPLPLQQYPHIVPAHGAGGRIMHTLIDEVFAKTFRNPHQEAEHDSAVVEAGGVRLAFTTDSYTVSPLFFPGGDIGALAVYGTVNDLAMSGARPLYLSAGFILEEGLPITTLQRVAASMSEAADRAGVAIVTGDTKVVERGKGDGVYINTAGVGILDPGVDIGPRSVREGDTVIVSGDIGRHGMAIMAAREGLQFESAIESDLAPLAGMVADLVQSGVQVHCLRDLTRGGLASALNEIAQTSGLAIAIEESRIAVHEDVSGICELLGFDPLHVANEGRLVAFVAPEDAERAINIIRAHPDGAEASIIGCVKAGDPGMVTMKTFGGWRIVDMLSGGQLPRIC